MASKQTEILMTGGFLKPGDILIKKSTKIKSKMHVWLNTQQPLLITKK
jgi:hypothetical protein